MSKKTQRKKPGYTKNGEVKIVSLNIQQLEPLLEKASKKKERAKIQNRLTVLKARRAKSGNFSEHLADVADAINTVFAEELATTTKTPEEIMGQ